MHALQIGSVAGGSVYVEYHDSPTECPCQGTGWLLSEYDSWHKCPSHNVGQPHPEEDRPYNWYEMRLLVLKLVCIEDW